MGIQFFSRLRGALRPRYVNLTIHVDVLRQMGGEFASIADAAESHRGIFLPRFVLEPISSDHGANSADSDCDEARSHKGKSEPSVAAQVTPSDPLPSDLGVERVIDPFANSHSAHACGNRRAVWPVTADAGNQRRAGHAGHSMPPVKILSDAGDRHASISATTAA